jgi:hypothetical protein
MTAEAGIKAAMSVARDLAEGTLDPDALDVEVVTACRSLVGVVVGEGDPLWPLQLDITRQVLALGGVPVTELAEWLAVLRQRQDGLEPPEPLDGHNSPHDG